MGAARRAVVVGGGVGGLAAARALMRKGVDVHVYEQAHFFSPTAGAGQLLQPNGAACLRALGIGAPALASLVHPLQEVSLYGHEGRELVRSDAFAAIQAKYAPLPFGGIVRAELIELLMEPVAAEGRVHHGKVLSAASQGPRGVEVVFEDGETVQADLLVGADGVHSKVADVVDVEYNRAVRSGFTKHGMRRALPHAPADAAREADHTFYGVIDDGLAQPFTHPGLGVPGLLLEDVSQDEFISYCMGGVGAGPGAGAVVEVGEEARAAGWRGTLMWALTYRPLVKGRRYGEEWTERAEGDSAHELLAAHMDRAGYRADHPVREAAARTPAARLQHFPIAQRDFRDVWHCGRICLLGDACHPTLPYVAQGANMALEDAVVLAEAVAGAGPEGLEMALDEYTRRRQARTRAVVLRARANGAVLRARTSGVLARARDSMLGMLASSGMMAKAFEDVIDGCPVPLSWPAEAEG